MHQIERTQFPKYSETHSAGDVEFARAPQKKDVEEKDWWFDRLVSFSLNGNPAASALEFLFGKDYFRFMISDLSKSIDDINHGESGKYQTVERQKQVAERVGDFLRPLLEKLRDNLF